MGKAWLIASGKGGVGKSTVVSSLGQALARMRQKVCIVDADIGLRDQDALLGMDSQQIRYHSQQVKKVFVIDHPIPNYQMGRLYVALNSLRTQVREVELSAARAFSCADSCSRSDLIEGLNRMSSCVYIILCRKLSGYYDRGNRL